MAFATSAAAFNIKPTTTSSVFGAPKQPATNAFGGGNAFGQSTNSVFGQPAQQNQTPSVFGQPAAQTQPQGGLFGQSQAQPQTGGLFGQQQQQQPATGGLFGQPQQQQPATGGLFGQTQQQQQPATGGLFGQTQTQQPAAGTGLFGQPQQQPATTGLFGQSQAQQPATGLFGQSQTAQQPATGGLFGNTQTGGGLFGNTQNNTQQTGGGLFGASQTIQQPATGGLFGGAGASAFGAPKPAGSTLFGGGATQQPQQQASTLFGGASTTTNPLFGGTASTTTNPLFGGSSNTLFGAKPAQPQPSQGAPPFTKSTKFNDLPDNIKKTFEEIDTHIQSRIQISKGLHERKLGEEATKGRDLIRVVHTEIINTATAIHNDFTFVRDLRNKTDTAVEDTIVATRIIDGYRNPHANMAYLKDHAGFPLEFFTRVTEQMRQRLAWYKSTIEQIERKLSSSAGQAQTPQSIHATLQAQNATFLALAAKTAALDAQLQKIKQLYAQLLRSRTGSNRDPFEGDAGDGPDLGLGSLRM
ncbi:hypothetical protein MIND_00267700 [Mycena indigotica]|uniref:Nucleoporin nup45 n=1 Tax=Mycena indigotica TaxID=2126181 RepID=A0A8H6T686_9AGAR|nr:uncharacterized protein MIND_00267700 [Mycena indigotica]KAF7312538.1 hypothetical protein MIND_00267700 [Mycena indigotica]